MKIKPLHWLLGAGALFLGYKALKPKTATATTNGTGNGTGDGNGGVVPPLPGSSNGGPGGPGGPGGVGGGGPTILQWNDATKALVTSKMEEIFESYSPEQQELNMAMIFTLARDTVIAVWPNEPWPNVLADLDSVSKPGYPGQLVEKWILQAGAKGDLLSMIWRESFEIAQKIYEFAPGT